MVRELAELEVPEPDLQFINVAFSPDGELLDRYTAHRPLLLVTEDFSTETQGLEETVAQTAWKDMLEIFPSAQLTREVTPFAPLSSSTQFVPS